MCNTAWVLTIKILKDDSSGYQPPRPSPVGFEIDARPNFETINKVVSETQLPGASTTEITCRRFAGPTGSFGRIKEG